MLDVKDGVEALQSWLGEGEYLLTASAVDFDSWYDSRVYCENPVALENAIREFRSTYHVLPFVKKARIGSW